MSKKDKLSFKHLISLNELGGYFFRKKKNHEIRSFNLKAMHGINKVAIIVFLLGIVYVLIKHIIYEY